MTTNGRACMASIGLIYAVTPAAFGAAEQASSADAFVDTIGVNAHWSYAGTPYMDHYPQVKDLLIRSGIRHVRGELSKAQELAASGIKTLAGVDVDPHSNGDDATITNIIGKIKAANTPLPAIDIVEGPNEPDFFWEKTDSGDKYGYGAKSYKGQGYQQGASGIIKGVVAFQKDLYAALKADPATVNLPVVGPAMGKTYGYDVGSPLGKGTLTSAVDWGNFHPYPGGNPFSQHFNYDSVDWYIGHGTFPSAMMDTDDHFDYAFDIGAPPFAPKPMAATETGYSTNFKGGQTGQTEEVQAKYMPRLFCEYFRHGIRRTYSYEFVDEHNDTGKTDREANFGLVRNDLTPKPAYLALKNMISILQEKNVPASFQPGSLAWTLAVTPPAGLTRTQYVHHLLLQKSNGDFYLALWHEISDEDGSASPHRIITPPDMSAVVSLPVSIRSVTLYSPNDSTEGLATSLVDHVVHLGVPDRVVILRLSSRPVPVEKRNR